jgi:hypothetical protein
MTDRAEIIRMARECGLMMRDEPMHGVEHFAALVAAAEREACAELCDYLDDDLPDGLAGWQFGEAIRARSKA